MFRFDGDAKTTETGYVTSPEQLPITGVAVDVAGGGSGTITLRAKQRWYEQTHLYAKKIYLKSEKTADT